MHVPLVEITISIHAPSLVGFPVPHRSYLGALGTAMRRGTNKIKIVSSCMCLSTLKGTFGTCLGFVRSTTLSVYIYHSFTHIYEAPPHWQNYFLKKL